MRHATFALLLSFGCSAPQLAAPAPASSPKLTGALVLHDGASRSCGHCFPGQRGYVQIKCMGQRNDTPRDCEIVAVEGEVSENDKKSLLEHVSAQKVRQQDAIYRFNFHIDSGAAAACKP